MKNLSRLLRRQVSDGTLLRPTMNALYFEALVTVLAIAVSQWLVAFRDGREAPSKSALLARFGLNGPNINTCLWSGI